jgi:hypothetical protein
MTGRLFVLVASLAGAACERTVTARGPLQHATRSSYGVSPGSYPPTNWRNRDTSRTVRPV